MGIYQFPGSVFEDGVWVGHRSGMVRDSKPKEKKDSKAGLVWRWSALYMQREPCMDSGGEIQETELDH